jgi:hypothetical protein
MKLVGSDPILKNLSTIKFHSIQFALELWNSPLGLIKHHALKINGRLDV